MATTAQVVKNNKVKYKVRKINRCSLCGRDRGYYKKFGLCRICLRSLAHKGEIPGLVKSSW